MARSIVHPRFLAQTAGRLGRGGMSWTRRRASGDGITAAVVPEETTITATAWKAQDLRTALALAQTELSETEWYVGGAPDLDLIGGDVLTSQAEAGFALLIHGPADDALPGLLLWRAAQQG